MSDWFFRAVRGLGRPIVWMITRPVVLGAEHAAVAGRCLVAPNHQAPYDIPLLMRHLPRVLDFVSIPELCSRPLAGRFLRGMNAFPLDRGRPDRRAARGLIERLERDRMVVMFPEAQFRREADSVVSGGSFRRGIGRVAIMTGAPILPCAILGSNRFGPPASWLPIRGVRYGIAFAPPIVPPAASTPEQQRIDAARLETRWAETVRDLHAALRTAVDPPAPA